MFAWFRRPAPHPLVQQDNGTYRVQVRTRAHGETLELRFTRSAHLSLDDDGTYLLRKTVVSSRHLDRGELLLRFDRQGRVTHAESTGLDFIPVSDWT